ncbi:hypothetical protein NMY22_g12328 [Coprinellus aureogranulatus]|nr:hypothetical protein NMY22_g12328 [Coprinellus aureogranulatus]
MPPRPAYQVGPMGPPNWEGGEPPRKRMGYSMPEAITQQHSGELPPLKTKRSGFLYDMGDGEVFYSPNCHRPNVVVPRRLPVASSTDPGPSTIPTSRSGVLFGQDYNIDVFREPQWWTDSQGYFAFVPRFLNTCTPTFSCLRSKPSVRWIPAVGAYCPDSFRWGEWRKLDMGMRKAISLIKAVVSVPAVVPAYPCAHIDSRRYRGVKEDVTPQLAEDIDSAEGWFTIWAGILAFHIAILSAVGDKAGKLSLTVNIPSWMTALLHPAEGEGLGPVFVDDLAQTVARFDGSIERVGAFIELPESPRGDMVSVDWLLVNDVPVWWHWGPREEAIVSKYPVFARYRPRRDALRVYGRPFSPPATSVEDGRHAP